MTDKRAVKPWLPGRACVTEEEECNVLGDALCNRREEGPGSEK